MAKNDTVMLLIIVVFLDHQRGKEKTLDWWGKQNDSVDSIAKEFEKRILQFGHINWPDYGMKNGVYISTATKIDIVIQNRSVHGFDGNRYQRLLVHSPWYHNPWLQQYWLAIITLSG